MAEITQQEVDEAWKTVWNGEARLREIGLERSALAKEREEVSERMAEARSLLKQVAA